MSPFSARELLRRAGVTTVEGCWGPDVPVTVLTDDSREVIPGAMFAAVPGNRADGARFIEAAVAAGATAVLTERNVPVPAGVLALQVPDVRVALARVAATYYGVGTGGPRVLRLVGITGTNGKTTTAWLLRSILQAAGRRPALLGTVEYDLISRRCKAPLTTPGSIQVCRLLAEAADAGATDAVLEVSSHALDQHRCDGLAFAAGVFTNLTGDHLDYHQTMDRYLAAKRRLFAGLDAEAVAVVNADDPAWERMLTGCAARRTLRYGIDHATVEVCARGLELSRRGSRFIVEGAGPALEVGLPLIGRHNVHNALAAAAGAAALGIPPTAIRTGLEGLGGVPGRLERVEPPGCPFTVLVDYAHTDDALEHVLSVLRPLTPGRLICVFGCGGDRDRTKRPRMAAVVERNADLAVVTNDNPRSERPEAIIDEILLGFSAKPRCRVEVCPDRREAIERALTEAGPGDTVLIAGKGHEDYQLVGDQVLHFDDRETARAWLAASRMAEHVA
ncbi:MAG TPA: UDP-N-acetylmuramoyl-L-alanyl-D-glutamate--2,6-diaminopimelate ligase [Phycisphaerae bacterium]|nr:UDP-N-acetylmuramoyl-L-alanyl-D-glutamate--2,6-diaminopimelate ligase [Phycisphaerae bacterium]HNU44717.1 UDP-N-acetylmuramoyl-L-alanyl-D-glutamate--2,6-diaminopimelate ligase [Phycisphaerae bacterium]